MSWEADKWYPLELTVRTPMFISGLGPTPELRIASLRGALRFWFRALAAPSLSDSLPQLATVEASIFGHGGDQPARSDLRLRLAKPPATTPADLTPDWLGNHVGYLLGQQLFQPGRNRRLRADYFAPQATARVEIAAGKAPSARAAAICLSAMDCFGGLGKRTRRGFGGVSVAGLDALGLAPSDPIDWKARAKSLVHEMRRVLESVNAPLSPVVFARDPATTIHDLPTFPSFSCWDASTTERGHGTWFAALESVGKELRDDRAPNDHGRYNHTIEYDKIVSHNPPPGDQDFPLAAYGLPIGFRSSSLQKPFEGTRWANAYTNGVEGRRASPLWLRPLESDGEWRVLSHVFFTRFLGEGAGVKLRVEHGGLVDLNVTDQLVVQRLAGWLARGSRPVAQSDEPREVTNEDLQRLRERYDSR